MAAIDSRPDLYPGRPVKTTDNVGLDLLICAVSRGDFEAMATLRTATAAMLFGVAYRRVRNHADADDVVAEVYLRVWLHAGTFDPARGPAGAWLTTLCVNAAIDCLRRSQTRSFAGQAEPAREPDPSDSPESLLERQQLDTAVRDALANLSLKQRKLLDLIYFKDMSHKQVSALAQLPLGTVKCWVRRSLKKMRQDMQARGVPYRNSCDKEALFR